MLSPHPPQIHSFFRSPGLFAFEHPQLASCPSRHPRETLCTTPALATAWAKAASLEGIDNTGPNTVVSSTVEQFHLLFLNWYWHSPIPLLAPLPTWIMWSVYNMHNFSCPADSPFILLHRGEVVPTLERRYCSGWFTTLYPCNPIAIQFPRDLTAIADVTVRAKIAAVETHF